jgi:ADP-ribose pyrophosphatase
VLSQWATLTARWVAGSGFDDSAPYHSLSQYDYVTVLATTTSGEVALVEQYRPALERVMLELPGGLVDPGRDPAAVAVDELREETGLVSPAEPELLGTLDPDSGRLENRLWCYRLRNCEPVADWLPEANVRPVRMAAAALAAAVAEGRFTHALHIGVLGLASAQGSFQLDGLVVAHEGARRGS